MFCKLPPDVRRLIYAYLDVTVLLRCSSAFYGELQGIMTRLRSTLGLSTIELGMWMVWWASTSRQTTPIEIGYWIDGKQKQEERILLWGAASNEGIRARYRRGELKASGTLYEAMTITLIMEDRREIRSAYYVVFEMIRKRVLSGRSPDRDMHSAYASRLIRRWLDGALSFLTPWANMDPLEVILSDSLRLVPGSMLWDSKTPVDVERSRLARRVLTRLDNLAANNPEVAYNPRMMCHLRQAIGLVYMMRVVDRVLYDDSTWRRLMPLLKTALRNLHQDVRRYT